jgi:hypothetical protein
VWLGPGRDVCGPCHGNLNERDLTLLLNEMRPTIDGCVTAIVVAVLDLQLYSSMLLHGSLQAPGTQLKSTVLRLRNQPHLS